MSGAAPLLAAALAFGSPSVTVVRDPAPGGGTRAQIEGVIDIEASPAVVWAVMLDCARAPAFVPGLQTCEVLEADPDGAWDVRAHEVRWAWPLPRARVEFRSDYARERAIRFAKTGGDLDVLDGAWTLTPLAEGAATRLTYSARIGVGAPLPGPLFRRRVGADARAVLEAVRTEAIRDSAGN